VPGDEVAAGYAKLLAREPWHWFATLTFSPTKVVRDKWTQEKIVVDRFHPIRGMHLEAADKAFGFWVQTLNRKVYGNGFRKVPHGGIVWARGQEFHKSGRVHFHAVLAAPDGDLNRLASRYQFHELWFREFGRNQIERPRDQDEVVGYVSKYVAKDGEVDFSRNFGTAKPLRIFDAEQDRELGILPTIPKVSGAHLATKSGHEEAPETAFLSLTHESRPQHRFSDESFYAPNPTETDQCAS
jgi:hypothetical protein